MSTDRSAPLDNNHVNNNKYFNNLSNSGISFLTLDNIESESAYLLTIDSIVPVNTKDNITNLGEKITLHNEDLKSVRTGVEFAQEPSIYNAVRYISSYFSKEMIFVKEINTLEKRKLESLLREHKVKPAVISIKDLVTSIFNKCKIEKISSPTIIPTHWGEFNFIGFRDTLKRQHIAIYKGNIQKEDLLTRVHSECLTGDVFGSKKCDCGEQLANSFKRINEEGSGVIIYLEQEGRGIGIVNKLNAYFLQQNGKDTVIANHLLTFPNDVRDFEIANKILKHLNVNSIRLLTNNPEKIDVLRSAGIAISYVEPLLTRPTDHNIDYLKAKKNKLKHLLQRI